MTNLNKLLLICEIEIVFNVLIADPSFIAKIITRDESWVYCNGYDLEMKLKSTQWKANGSPRFKKATTVRRCMEKNTRKNVFFFTMTTRRAKPRF